MGNVREKVLSEATRLTTGDRDEVYGGPEDSFITIAKLWTVYLEERKLDFTAGSSFILAPDDVALMLDLLKTARLIHSNGNHWDSWVDKAGYAACGAECAMPDGPEPEKKDGPEPEKKTSYDPHFRPPPDEIKGPS